MKIFETPKGQIFLHLKKEGDGFTEVRYSDKVEIKGGSPLETLLQEMRNANTRDLVLTILNNLNTNSNLKNRVVLYHAYNENHMKIT